MKQKFYRCAVCGQIVAMVKETPVPIMCCGAPMQEIIAGERGELSEGGSSISPAECKKSTFVKFVTPQKSGFQQFTMLEMWITLWRKSVIFFIKSTPVLFGVLVYILTRRRKNVHINFG